MTNDFTEPVQKIVNNYLSRLRGHLRGLPEVDQEELVREIYSHIYESYTRESTGDEIERIFLVLDRLGEPSEVVASRVSGTMKKMGKKRKLPLYILAGFLIGMVGVPLGMGGLALFLGIAITLAALVFTYYVAAGVFLVGGWLTLVVTFIRLFYPTFLIEYVHLMDQFLNPPLSVIFNFVAAAAFTFLGVAMFKWGRHLLRGTSFLFALPGDAVKRIRHRGLPGMTSREDNSVGTPIGTGRRRP